MKKLAIICLIIIGNIPICIAQVQNNDNSAITNTMNGFFFGLEDDLQNIIGKLGEPQKNNNEEKLNTYVWDNGLIIETINKHYISMITIRNTGFKTQKGISVNDSFAKVVQIYGRPVFKYDTLLSYYLNSEKGTVIIFKFEDNKVKEIIIGYGS